MAVVAAIGPALSGRAAEAQQARWPRLGALVLDFIGFSVLLTVVNLVYGTTATGVAWPWIWLLWMAYYVVPESLYGASLGKMLTGLSVVRVDSRPVSVGSILTRNVLRFVDILPGFYLIGGLFTLLTEYSQRVGDKWAGTTVVARAHALQPGATRHPPRRANRVLASALVLALVFTIGFEYFGRPALVLETLFSEHLLLAPDHLTSYQLGAPQWGFGSVTYPLTAYEGGQACSGSISLQWSWPLGWTMSEGTLLCPP